MKRTSLLFFVIFTVIFALSGYTQQAFKYVGSKKCAPCHISKESGSQYIKWLRGRHAHAYWRLGSDWSKFLAQQKEKYKDIKEPIKEGRCLKCHSTAYGKSPRAFAESFYKEEGVGCETCHGPGSAYMEESIMKNREKFLKNGGIIPTKKLCVKCHHRGEFKFEERVKDILHPIPKKS